MPRVERPSDVAALDGGRLLGYLTSLRGAARVQVPRVPDDAAAWSAFVARLGNTAWLAEDAAGPFGFLRFDREFDGADVAASETGVFISGAYVRASQRHPGAATAILDAALRHNAAAGLAYCAVDFEAFNPEAAGFWPRHFRPVCYSLMRVPEATGPGPR